MMKNINKMNYLTVNSGFSLLEVLVTVLILGIGLLGVAAIQTSSIRNNQSAYERTMAVILTDSVIESIRASRTASINGAFNKVCAAGAPASGIQGVELSKWSDKLKKTLGSDACGEIYCATGNCYVTIKWSDTRGTAGKETLDLTTRFSI
jgi:type IV pilus assembly protein PilV